MPRDKDKDNGSWRGRRDRPGGRKDRGEAVHGGERKFAKRGFGGKREDGEERRRRDGDERPHRRRDGDTERRDFRDERGGRGRFRDDAPRPRFNRGQDAPGDAKPYRKRDNREREERGRGERPYVASGRETRGNEDRPEFSRPRFERQRHEHGEDRKGFATRPGGYRKGGFENRGPREDRGGEERSRFPRGRDQRKGDDRPKFDRPRFERQGRDNEQERERFAKRPAFGGRGGEERSGFPRGRDQRKGDDRPKFDRPRFERQGRDNEQERERFAKRPAFGGRGGEERSGFPRGRDQRKGDDRPKFDRPRFERQSRDNEQEHERFAKRPAFGGRGAYRERKVDFDRRAPREEAKPKKAGERIAKVVARAGLASRRDAEEWIVQGRVAVNGRIINSPALDVTANDVIAVDGKPLPARERTRLFLYHKPRGLMTTHADPEGRPTVFDNLPEGLPRLISVGRLDFNTEGLLLLTNDGGLARVLELPETGWLRRYRVRAHGEITQGQLDELRNGVEVDGVKYGPIDATLEREQGANVWLVFAIREGKNREVRNVLAHIGLEVNRLIRVSYGPFQLGEIAEGAAEEVKTRVLREQLGEKIIAQAGCDFARGESASDEEARETPRGKKPFHPAGTRERIADRKGRSILVQRSGSEEARARNEAEARGYGPPRRPKRGYHGKRDLKPRQE